MSRNKLSHLLVILAISLLAVQCDKNDRSINLNLTEVSNFFTPADGKYVLLKPAQNLTETFEWEPSKAEDGGLVLYEIAFDEENGDFSQPFYVLTSDNKGVLNKLTISHGDLNKVAELGGAAFFEKKKFKWTVLASKGTNIKRSALARTIELERPGGFAVLPGSVYMAGTATENGASLATALQMKQISPGLFEIFTKMKAGTYKFYDGNTGTPRQFYVFDDNGVNAIGVNGESTFSGADRIMRIRLDFNNINASFAEVKSVQLWYSAGNTFWATLPYTGNGVWRVNNHVVNYTSMPWGFEERHKYKMVLNSGSGDQDLWLNYTTNDSPGQDGQYPHTVAYRTINMTTNNGSQWDWTFKFDRNYLTQGSTADFWISLRGSDPAYTMNYQKH
jgi:hypothetical protein